MKGLLVKDFRLLLNQKQFFLVCIFIGLFLAFILPDVSFITGYLTFIFSMFTVSTISYDEFDNGNAFLFTLPFKRTTYVKEKYVFGILASGFGILISSTILIVYQLFTAGELNASEIMISQIAIIPTLFLLLSIMIPLQLKFGGEKSRIALIGFFGVIFVIGYLTSMLMNILGVDFNLLLHSLSFIDDTSLLIALIVISLFISLLSEKISEKIMMKKEL